MRRLVFFAVGVLLALGLAWWLSRNEPKRHVAVSHPAPTLEYEEEIPGPDPVTSPTPTPTPTPTSITGRVYRGGQPLADAQVVLGAETATTDAFGVFALKTIVRPRFLDLEVRQGGEVLTRWARVVTGGENSPMENSPAPNGDGSAGDGAGVAVESAAGAESIGLPGAMDLPERLGRVLWTVHVGVDEGRDVPSEWLHVEEGFAAQWELGGRVRLRGPSTLPANTRLTASAYFEELRSFASMGSFQVSGGAFETDMFARRDQELYSACYDIRVTYNQILQSRELKGVLLKDPDTPLAILQTTEDRTRLFLGSPSEALMQDAEAQKYFAEVWEESRFLFRELEARRAELVRLATDWDPALLRTFTTARDEWLQPRFFDDSGRFDESRWRRYLDEGWRLRLRELLSRHLERGSRKYVEASRHGGQVLSNLDRLSQIYSAFVIYPGFRLRGPHPNDFFQDAMGLGDAVAVKRTIDRSSYELERFQEFLLSMAPCTPPWRDETGSSASPEAPAERGGKRSF